MEDHKLLVFVLIMLIIIIVRYRLRTTEHNMTVQYEWDQHLSNFNFSPEQFYEIVQEIIEEKNIPNVYVQKVWLLENGWLSRRRYYLKVSRNETVFLICALQFGDKDFFISYRQGIKGAPAEEDMVPMTYYQVDAEKSFKEIVHKSILKAIETISKFYGYRINT